MAGNEGFNNALVWSQVRDRAQAAGAGGHRSMETPVARGERERERESGGDLVKLDCIRVETDER